MNRLAYHVCFPFVVVTFVDGDLRFRLLCVVIFVVVVVFVVVAAMLCTNNCSCSGCSEFAVVA